MPEQKQPILMSAENPDGWKLEDLLAQVQKELMAKNLKIIGDDSKLACFVRGNNYVILTHLIAAEQLQRKSYEELAKLRPDEGPNGKARIG